MADESKQKETRQRAAKKEPTEAGGKGKDKKKRAEKGEKKPVTAGAMLLICFLLFLLIMVAGFAVLNFNLFDMRTRAIILLAAGASPYENEREELMKLQLDLQTEMERQAVKEAELEARTETLDRRETAIAAEEERIAADRADLEVRIEEFSTRQIEFEQLVAIYGNMDAARAAEALSLLENIDDIARLLSSLRNEQAAGILGNMEAALAASVTQRMIP